MNLNLTSEFLVKPFDLIHEKHIVLGSKIVVFKQIINAFLFDFVMLLEINKSFIESDSITVIVFLINVKESMLFLVKVVLATI
jgi:hypothetical protein